MTPLVLQVSMGGGDRLPSGDPSARLPSYLIKKKKLIFLDCLRGSVVRVLASQSGGRGFDSRGEQQVLVLVRTLQADHLIVRQSDDPCCWRSTEEHTTTIQQNC